MYKIIILKIASYDLFYGHEASFKPHVVGYLPGSMWFGVAPVLWSARLKIIDQTSKNQPLTLSMSNNKCAA